MRSVGTRLKNQGPRALRVGALAFLAGVLLYLDHPGHVGPLPTPMFTGLIYAGMITPAAVITALVMPGLTALSDAVQIARLLFASAVALVPAVFRPLADQPLINASVVILGGMAIIALSRRLPGGARLSLLHPGPDLGVGALRG